MAECIILKGGGGADLDVVTAGSSDVLAGKVIVDKNGEPLTGTMPANGGTYWNNSLGLGMDSDNFYSFFPIGNYSQYDVRGALHRIPIGRLQAAIGATPAKILSGQSIAGVAGEIAQMAGQYIVPGAYQQTVSCAGKYMTGNVVVDAVNVFKEGGITGTASSSTLQTYTFSDGTQRAFPYVLLQVPSLSQIRSFTAVNSNATYYTSYDALSGICEVHKYLDPAYHFDIRVGFGSGNTMRVPVYAAGTYAVKYYGY